MVVAAVGSTGKNGSMGCSSLGGAWLLSDGGSVIPGRVGFVSGRVSVSGPSQSADYRWVVRAASVPRDLWWSEW